METLAGEFGQRSSERVRGRGLDFPDFSWNLETGPGGGRDLGGSLSREVVSPAQTARSRWGVTMIRYFTLVFLVGALSAQEPVCFTYDGEKTVPVSCREIPRKNQFRELPDRKPSWASRHRTRMIWLSLGAGATAGGLYSWVSRQHCSHYPAGYSGVGVNCPK